MSQRDNEIDVDALEEVREILEYAIEGRRWADVEEAYEALSDLLGYDEDELELEE